MGRLVTWSALLVLLGVCGSNLAQVPMEGGEAQRIDQLVQQLGSTKYLERDRAQKELEGLGEKALGALKKAAQGEDLETSRRATELVRKLEEKITTANILAPKKVHLKVADVSVLEAVNQLGKLSGYPVRIDGDTGVLANRKVTIDTGLVSFWEALDRLCAEGGLVEKHGAIVPTIQRDGPIKIRPPLRVQPLPVQPLPVQPVPRLAPQKVLPFQAEPVPPLPIQPVPMFVPRRIQVVPVQPAQIQAAPAQPVPAPPEIEQAAPAKAVQAVPGNIRVQAQVQVQAVPLQLQPAFPGNRLQPGGETPITVQPGKAPEYPTYYAGAVRFRLVPAPAGQPVTPGRVLYLEVTPEPRMQGFHIVGSPNVTKAVDDQGQAWTLAMGDPANNNPNFNPNVAINGNVFIANGVQPNVQQRIVPLRFQKVANPSETLKELAGTVTAQVMLPPEPLLTMNNVLKAAGQTVKGKDNGSMTLQGIDKINNNTYRVQVSVENVQNQNPLGGNVQIIGGGQVMIRMGGVMHTGTGDQQLPRLLDAKGNAYKVQQITNRSVQINNGVFNQNLTIQYQADNNQEEPDRLVQVGTRGTSVAVPFQFQNVRVP